MGWDALSTSSVQEVDCLSCFSGFPASPGGGWSLKRDREKTFRESSWMMTWSR